MQVSASVGGIRQFVRQASGCARMCTCKHPSGQPNMLPISRCPSQQAAVALAAIAVSNDALRRAHVCMCAGHTCGSASGSNCALIAAARLYGPLDVPSSYLERSAGGRTRCDEAAPQVQIQDRLRAANRLELKKPKMRRERQPQSSMFRTRSFVVCSLQEVADVDAGCKRGVAHHPIKHIDIHPQCASHVLDRAASVRVCSQLPDVGIIAI